MSARKGLLTMKDHAAAAVLKTVFGSLAAVLLLFGGFAADAAVDSVITAIDVEPNVVKVTVQGPVKYTVQKTADPFVAVVELEGVSVGAFKEKIISKAQGINEIVPMQLETPVKAARLTLLLQAPSVVRADLKDSILYISLDKSAAPEAAVKQEQPSASGTATAITEVYFDKADGGLELIIKADGKLLEPAVYQLDNSLILDIPGVAMRASLPGKNPDPVKDIKVKTEKDKTRFNVTLVDKTLTDVYIMDDEVVVDIMPKEGRTRKSAATDKTAAQMQEKAVNGTKVISLDFQDADIVPILRLLGDVGGYNTVIHPEVKGKITMKLMNVPWNQALDIVLKTFNLEKVIEGNIIRIATVKAFQEEKRAVAETKDIFGKAEDISIQVFVMNYAQAEKVKDAIEKAKVLSTRGSISTDLRTRSVIIKDTQASIEEVKKLLVILDKPTQQVLIEARMVEVNTQYAKSLGVDWGLMARNTSRLPNTVARAQGAAPNPSNVVGSSIPGGGYSVINPNTGTEIRTIEIPQLINLPATSGRITNPTSALTLGFLNSAETLGIDLRISALEANGKAKIVSNPKIMTESNPDLKTNDTEVERGVVIKHGARIPVATRSSDGTYTTVYIDANLKLVVDPQISSDGTVSMKLKITKDEPDFTRVDILGNPTINGRSASTQVILKDGETIVIGGILRSTHSKDDSGVPGLSKIPLLGYLFRRDTIENTDEELLIFITPTIVK